MFKKPIGFYASLADIISGVMIVMSLVYAFYEYNRSERSEITNANQSIYSRVSEYNLLLVTTPGLAEVVVIAETDPEKLISIERRKYLAYQEHFLDTWLEALGSKNNGLFTEETWSGWDYYFSKEMKTRPRFAWLENRKHYGNKPFIELVDKTLGITSKEKELYP